MGDCDVTPSPPYLPSTIILRDKLGRYERVGDSGLSNMPLGPDTVQQIEQNNPRGTAKIQEISKWGWTGPTCGSARISWAAVWGSRNVYAEKTKSRRYRVLS
jgi:hypothetical protein